MSVWPLILALGIALAIGVPIGIAMGLGALVFILVNGLPLSQLPQICYGAADNLVLIAIPMFLLAGALMEKGGLTRRIVDLSDVIIGGTPGGLGAVTILACTFFAALSGSGPATTAAIGALLIPEMKRRGYPGSYAGGISASAGGIGIVIPPSIPLIVYSIMAEKSATRLFLAGFLPGIVLAAALLLFNYFWCKKENYLGSGRKFSLRELLRQMWKSKWALLAPIIILGGIYSGATTVTEASAIAVFYSLIAGLIIYKELTLRKIWEALVSTLRTTGVAFILLASGQILARQLVVADVPTIMSTAILSITSNKIFVLLLIDALLIFIGMWMETIAQIIILTPVFMQVIEAIGVDPIHFGIIFVVACEIGFQTPPLGANLFIAKDIGGTTYEEVSKIGLLFAIAEIGALVIISIFPQISLFLPNLLMGE